jgi:hypothetical protein
LSNAAFLDRLPVIPALDRLPAKQPLEIETLRTLPRGQESAEGCEPLASSLSRSSLANIAGSCLSWGSQAELLGLNAAFPNPTDVGGAAARLQSSCFGPAHPSPAQISALKLSRARCLFGGVQAPFASLLLPAPESRENFDQVLAGPEDFSGISGGSPCNFSKSPCFPEFCREETASQLTASSTTQFDANRLFLVSAT